MLHPNTGARYRRRDLGGHVAEHPGVGAVACSNRGVVRIQILDDRVDLGLHGGGVPVRAAVVT